MCHLKSSHRFLTRSGTVLFVVAVILPNVFANKCIDPSYCAREKYNCSKTDEDVIIAPAKCRGHADVMKCFATCIDRPEVKKCYDDAKRNGSEAFCYLKYSRKLLDREYMDHPGLLCTQKCFTKPAYWSCIQKCDRKGCLNSFSDCENSIHSVSDPTNPSKKVKRKVCLEGSDPYFYADEACKQCYVEGLLAEKNLKNCRVRYDERAPAPTDGSRRPTVCSIGGKTPGAKYTNTKAYDYVTMCADALKTKGLKGTSEDMEECFKKFLTQEQHDSCILTDPLCRIGPSAVPGTNNMIINSPECRRSCMDVLLKPLCYVPCEFEMIPCEEQCEAWWPAMKCNVDAVNHFQNIKFRLDSFRNRYTQCAGADIWQCRFNCTHDDAERFRADENWSRLAVMSRNCKSKRYVSQFAKKLGLRFTESLEKLANHMTYYESFGLNCSKLYVDDDAYTCVQIYSEKDRDFNFMEALCDSMTLYEGDKYPPTLLNVFRVEIVLWCMLRQDPLATWSFESYMNQTEKAYINLLECETNVRTATDTSGFTEIDLERFVQISYEIEKEWSSECKMELFPTQMHPYREDLAKCLYRDCYAEVDDSEVCKPLVSTGALMRIALAMECRFRLDYSLSSDPYRIWSTYFNEIPAHDKTHELGKPNATKYLSKSTIGLGVGHYVFPYFLVLRVQCEDGFYTDEVYKFISSGASPTIQMKHLPESSREPIVDLVVATFQGTLVNLLRTTNEDKAYIPSNPMDQGNGGEDWNGKHRNESNGCHQNLCYPAYLIPHILVNIPIFQAVALDQQTITKADHRGYTTSFHLRDTSGKGSLGIADLEHQPSASDFFPIRKIRHFEDSQFLDLWERLPDSSPGQGDIGPELEHLEDHNCVPFEKKSYDKPYGYNPHAPLDSEDFFPIHFTYGSAPQAIIAGFYDPNLIIIGDPDMKQFELVRWKFQNTSGVSVPRLANLFYEGYKCFSSHNRIGSIQKPIYAQVDRLDPKYWLSYYRMRYLDHDYQDIGGTKAIFGAWSLEDRILLATSSGIVSFYQNLNVTANEGKAWQVEPKDRLIRCFKIVRIARRAHPKGDTIVGITYTYDIQTQFKLKNNETKSITRTVTQEIHVGHYEGKGKPIEWREIKPDKAKTNLNEQREASDELGDKRGGTKKLDEKKLLGVPVDRRETNPYSQIEAICFKAYRLNMESVEYLELFEDDGWCEAVDATPVTAKEHHIQILVRMKVYYSSGTIDTNTQGKNSRNAIFYVLASLNTHKDAPQVYQINSIIPRKPCQDEHEEAIPSVVDFNRKYFRTGTPDVIKGDYGCQTNDENQVDENGIYLHGMTYTRSYSHHLFLYGNRLLQSTDGGETFVMLSSFPLRTVEYGCEKFDSIYHRIKLMAFDDLGHYAFLTSKRELWYGSIGSLQQIRIRPSRAHSMVVTRVYQATDMTDAVPFSLFFDANNQLHEMVALVNKTGTVTRIARRLQNQNAIMRARHYIDKLEADTSKRMDNLRTRIDNLANNAQSATSLKVVTELLKDVDVDPLSWSTFCPYASPIFHHNFSALGRTHDYSLPPPRQHPVLGLTYGKTALYAYQAVTFNLIWNAFFHWKTPDESRSSDPFIVWQTEKKDASTLGRLPYVTQDPEQHGLLVLTQQYKRTPPHATLFTERRFYNVFYMDYGDTLELTLEFSVVNDFTLTKLDYLSHRLQSILLNVENSNGSLILINTEKTVLSSKAAIKYNISLSVNKNSGFQQMFSGRGGIQVPIKLHLIGGFGTCIPSKAEGVEGDSLATVLQVGCPPSLELMFDWEATVNSIDFRDVKAHYGTNASNCFSGKDFCFFARHPMKLYFKIFDAAKAQVRDYNGSYIMRIVAGGYTEDGLTAFTREEIQAYNIPGASDISLIWNEWDVIKKATVTRPSSYVKTPGRNDSRELVLKSGTSSVQFACHTLSPCARIAPTESGVSIYWFKVLITNRGVDNDTLCLFEREFNILLYGFPPSPEVQFLFTLIFYVGMLAILYLAFICLRNHKRVWRSTTLKITGWILVIKETFPKTWLKRFEPEEGETELEAQKRKDDIILSLQGHLNIPRLVPRSITTEEADDAADLTANTEDDTAAAYSVSSFQSKAKSDESQSQRHVIEPTQNRSTPATWSELVYEQTISSRLAGMLERNRQLEDGVRKATEDN